MSGYNLPIKSAQFSSLAFSIHEICITFDDEVNFIWSKPNDAWIKWLFLFTRYFILAAQITNRTIDLIITANVDSGMVNPSLMDWALCQAAVGGIAMLTVEIVLMARVYALYKKSMWVGSGFVALIIVKLAVMGTAFVMNIRGPSEVFPRTLSFLLFATGTIISQVTILALTLIKYWTAIREGWGSVPIMALIVRDGIVTFFILIVVSTVTAIATSRQNEYAVIGKAWLYSIAACAGCRLIINMQRLSRPERRTTVELTTL